MSKQFKTPIAPPALSSDPTGQVAGEIYYNTVSGGLKIFNGYTWSLLSGGILAGGLEVLGEAPSSPNEGRLYFDTSEKTIKIYNGSIWYDVAGPKEILDHTHYAQEGLVKEVQYSTYVADDLIFVDGGNSATTLFTGDIINGGNS